MSVPITYIKSTYYQHYVDFISGKNLWNLRFF